MAALPSDPPEEAAAAPPQFVRRKSKVQKGEGLWLMSFSDMSLILMSFFVLQLAYSNPDKRKYDNLNTALQEQQAKASPQAAPPRNDLKAIESKVRRLIRSKNLDKVAYVTYDMTGLSIEFRDQTLFAQGSASPNPRYAPLVEQVMQVIANAPGDYRLVLEGHTDDVAVAKGKYDSNWDLSAARGIALLHNFAGRGVATGRMSVQAYADTRPKVAITGLSGPALRQARAANRRVVVRLQ